MAGVLPTCHAAVPTPISVWRRRFPPHVPSLKLSPQDSAASSESVCNYSVTLCVGPQNFYIVSKVNGSKYRSCLKYYHFQICFSSAIKSVSYFVVSRKGLGIKASLTACSNCAQACHIMYVGRITLSYKVDRMGRMYSLKQNVLIAALLRSEWLRPPICSTRFSGIEELVFKNRKF